jgi:hypothetical protein
VSRVSSATARASGPISTLGRPLATPARIACAACSDVVRAIPASNLAATASPSSPGANPPLRTMPVRTPPGTRHDTTTGTRATRNSSRRASV